MFTLLVSIFLSMRPSFAVDPQDINKRHHNNVNCPSICRDMAYQPAVTVVSSGALGYNESLSSYWSGQEADLYPECIVKPSTECFGAVSDILELLSVSSCNFAVRGGGHTPWTGAANIDAGITIDLSLLTSVTVSADRTRTTIGAGARWSDVYSTLDPLGLAVAGGRASSVGVGGLTLGGGISFFSPRYGFVCDNVLAFELFGPDGDFRNVTDASHPELFKALKGGGNNFGIVTSFVMNTTSSGDFWGGFAYYPIETLSEQAKAFTELTGSEDYDPYAAVILKIAFVGAEVIIAPFFSYTKVPAVDSTPEFLSGMVNIQPSIGTIRSPFGKTAY